MNLLDSRRLTGKNLIWDHPGAVADIALDATETADSIAQTWLEIARETLDAVGWSDEAATTKTLIGGLSLAISAPIDALYAATDVIDYTVERLTGGGAETPGDAIERLRRAIADERNPPLLALEMAAESNGVACLSDDDEASVGLGRGSMVWPVGELPDAVDWDSVHDIPVGLVTGTNGKTTTVRLIAQMIRAAGLNVGLSSTDWIGVNDEIIDRGDWSGPGGARTILRHGEVDVAVLEAARGGLLRRGLGVRRADAALITNIAEDHLGDFGSQSLDELLAVKWVIMRALDGGGRAVLNADDVRLAAKSAELDAPITWFTLDPTDERVRAHIDSGGRAALANGSRLQFARDGVTVDVIEIDGVPITLHGAARHNVANALAAIGMADALNVPMDAIRTGLESFTADQNPGRCNLFDIDGVEVLLDFAHNPEGMAAVFDIAEARKARRRALCFAQAGDRTDDNIRELARRAWRIGPDRIVISELPAYRRGRASGEVFRLLSETLIQEGADPDSIRHHETELESLTDALDWAQAGDLVIMLGLGEQQALLEKLSQLSSSA